MESEQVNDIRDLGSEQTIVAEGKAMATVAYLTLIGFIIAWVTNKEKNNSFVTYHLVQMLGLCVCGLGLGVIGMIPLLGWAVSVFGSLFLLILWVLGLMNAANGKKEPVPVLGKIYQGWFKKVT